MPRLVFQAVWPVKTLSRGCISSEATPKQKKRGPPKLFLLVVVAHHVAGHSGRGGSIQYIYGIPAPGRCLPDTSSNPSSAWERTVEIFLFTPVVPGIRPRDKVLDYWKRLHRIDSDGLSVGRASMRGLASGVEALPFDFCRAGAALAGFTVPAHGEVGLQMPLECNGARPRTTIPGAIGNCILLSCARLPECPGTLLRSRSAIVPPLDSM